MNRGWKNGILAISAANLLLGTEWVSIFDPNFHPFYHRLPTVNGYAALILLFVSFAGLVFLGLQRADAPRRKWERYLIYFTILCWILLVVNSVRLILRTSYEHPFLSETNFLGNWGRVGNLIKVGLLAGAFLVFYLRRKEFMISKIRWGIAACALIPFLTIGRISYLEGYRHFKKWRRDSGFKQVVIQHPLGPEKVRVLWMVFDELDEAMMTRGRPAGVDLPNFDRLRLQSLTAQNAFPPAGATLYSMPSFITGKKIKTVRPRNESDLEISFCAEPGIKKDLRDSPSVFTDARASGIRTAIAGWYIPYCRALEGSFDYCKFYAAFQRQYPGSVVSNIGRMLSLMAGFQESERVNHLNLYNGVNDAAKEIVANPRYGLVFVHWPVPHAPQVNKSRVFHYGGDHFVESYFTNLMLADETMGEVRRWLEDSGEWYRTAVLVTGDHWWRFAPDSFVEDHLKPRQHYQVPFILKLPGQSSPVSYAKGFNTVVIRDLIHDLLIGKVRTPNNVTAWLDVHGGVEIPRETASSPAFNANTYPGAQCQAVTPPHS